MSNINKQVKEALVFIGEEEAALRYPKVISGTLRLYKLLPEVIKATDELEPQDNKGYEEFLNNDYIINSLKGTVCRSNESAIPDWRDHPMYGLNEFNQVEFDDYSNEKYTVYADYKYELTDLEDENLSQVEIRIDESSEVEGSLKRFSQLIEKIKNGRFINYAIIGDSISTGAEASIKDKAYFSLVAQWITQKTGVEVRIENKAIGGETSREGAERIVKDITPLQPDLVTIGYGMNDQNLFDDGVAVSVDEFKKNIKCMLDEVLEHTLATPILIAGCAPNPLWKHASGEAGRYAAAIREVGEELKVAVADVHYMWELELQAGKTPESLLLNNINHPNDYGHIIYSKAFQKLFLPWL